ncbi:MAG: SGNH/GDSL hydrolase family protein [Bacteroidales bacterium]|nr:SGNH/GDSL hydrolase family protein [Bacteroidales bacterium]
MNCSIEIDKTKYFLGYHYGVGEVLSLNIAPQPGMFFVNGETNSVWVWNTLNREWIDTNRVDSGMKGMLTNEVGNSPDDFIPSPQTGVKESYFYVAECDDVDVNPNATPKTITFTHFKNGSSAVSVTLKKTSIVILYWNGDYWETSIIPMNVNWSLLRTEINEIADKVGLYLYKDITIKGNTSPNIFSLEPYIGKEVSVKVSGNFTSFGYRDEALANGYRTIGESEKSGKWVNFYVPETATTFFVFNNTDLGVTTVDVEFRVNLATEVLEIDTLKRDLKEIDSKVGYIDLKGESISTIKRFFSLIPYIGKTVMVKVKGYFQNFGYYTDAEFKTYKSLADNKTYDGGYYSFVVPENATDFYVYTDNKGTIVDVEFRANLSADLFLKEVSTKGCVFMSLGDSITTESYYVPKLRDILQPSKYYNLAVAGAWWADREGTVYDGNPQFNGADNNVNNVIGNQVQKIINNPTLYADAPDIIIISAGTNDSGNMGVANNATIQEIREAIDANYRNEAGVIPITEPTFDENDTYHSYRKTIGGAMRYCVNKLQELFPRAKIYILTPIQGCYASRDYASSIATKQEYISESAKHLGVPVIHVGEECGISADFEYEGAMWNGPTGYHERSGRDLIDGLHPNTNGSKKMADYIALNIVSSFKTNGKIYSVVGSSLSVTGIVDGNTLKL